MSRLERWIDAYHWWRCHERHVLHLGSPIVRWFNFEYVHNKSMKKNRFPSYTEVSRRYRPQRQTVILRPDIRAWCHEMLRDQHVFLFNDDKPRVVFKHKTGLAMFRLCWSTDLAKMDAALAAKTATAAYYAMNSE